MPLTVQACGNYPVAKNAVLTPQQCKVIHEAAEAEHKRLFPRRGRFIAVRGRLAGNDYTIQVKQYTASPPLGIFVERYHGNNNTIDNIGCFYTVFVDENFNVIKVVYDGWMYFSKIYTFRQNRKQPDGAYTIDETQITPGPYPIII